MQETRIVSLDRLQEMQDVVFYRNINNKVRNLIFPSTLTSPYIYGVMNSYCDEDGKIIGQVMIGFNREVGAADLQMVDVVMGFLNSIENRAVTDNGNYLAEMLFDELIHGCSIHSEDLLKVAELQKWPENTAFCVVCSRIQGREACTAYHQAQMLTGLQQELYRRYPCSISVLEQNLLISCLPVNSEKIVNPFGYFSDRLAGIHQGGNVCFGVSYMFRDFTDARYYYLQALAALEYGREQGITCCGIERCALESCSLNPDTEYIRTCLHPVLPLLRETDRSCGTEYYETLRQYLRFERSYVDVAKHMQIHRNTVVYRMEKIMQVYPGLRLDDPEEREYLLFSYRIDLKQRKEC